MDAEALSAIAENLAGLERLSKERIGAEMMKLLAAPDPSTSIAAMRSSGVLQNILAGADDRLLSLFVHLETENSLPSDTIGRLAILGGQDVKHQLRLSNKQVKTYQTFRECMANNMPPHELGYRYSKHTALICIALRAALFEIPINKPDLYSAKRGALAQFPLSGQDLKIAFRTRNWDVS